MKRPLDRLRRELDARPRLRAELTAAGWELFSALLFASAVVPSGFSGLHAPSAIFLASLALSAALQGWFAARGARGFAAAGALRTLAWSTSFLPVARAEGWGLMIAAIAFGLMAGAIRRAAYRSVLEPEPRRDELANELRSRLTEAATTAGILGGHVMLLFSVAFLRTQNQVIYHAWFDIVPALAVFGTAFFTLAVRPLTRSLVEALRAGPEGDVAVLARGLASARTLPRRLARVNFVLWLVCTSIGAAWVHPPAKPGELVSQIGFGALFSWGVSFYQEAWVGDVCAPALRALGEWTAAPPIPKKISLRQRMTEAFGLPLVFTAALSLFASISLYRALAPNATLREDFDAVVALVASFALLVIAAGAVVARAARELSEPMTELAGAADRVAHGELDAEVERVAGPREVAVLGESIEGMRRALAATIAELERERGTLEQKVEARTAELRRALEDLEQAQLARLQGERLAAIGELVAGVAHEIHNPLTAVAGAAAPLGGLARDVRAVLDAYRAAEAHLPADKRAELEALRAELDLEGSLDDLRGITELVERATARAVRIVTNLRNFARQGGEPVPTDLHASLDEALLLLAARIRHASIRVDKRLGELPPITCRGGELNQVFLNLLVNAVQALEARAPAGDPPAIEIETTVEGGVARVAITDNGPGVPADIADRIFSPFFTTKPRGEGTGLGLSLSTEIVRRHGGRLRLEPSAAGARFVVELPLGAAAATPKPRAA